MARKRFNRVAICSSDNYQASRKMHQIFLGERHSHFCGVTVSGEITFDQPIFKDGKLTPEYKTVRVFGKNMQVTMEEYKEHSTLK